MADDLPIDVGALRDYLLGNLDAAKALLGATMYEELRKAMVMPPADHDRWSTFEVGISNRVSCMTVVFDHIRSDFRNDHRSSEHRGDRNSSMEAPEHPVERARSMTCSHPPSDVHDALMVGYFDQAPFARLHHFSYTRFYSEIRKAQFHGWVSRQ